MTTAEMILKIVMSPTDSVSGFVDQCRKLLPDLKIPDFQKILEMKVRNNGNFVCLTLILHK